MSVTLGTRELIAAFIVLVAMAAAVGFATASMTRPQEADAQRSHTPVRGSNTAVRTMCGHAQYPHSAPVCAAVSR